MNLKFYIFIGLLLLSSCQNLEDAEPTERDTFIKFYSSSINLQTTVAKLDTDGGYIIAGNLITGVEDRTILIIKTDLHGTKIWETTLPEAEVNDILPLENGYFIIGTRIKLSRVSSDISELRNTQALVLYMDKNGNIAENKFTVSDTLRVDGKKLHIDYEGNSLNLDPDGNLILLTSVEPPSTDTQENFKKTELIAIHPETLDIIWRQTYGQVNRRYDNCNSLLTTNSGNYIWSSTSTEEQLGITDNYISVQYAPANKILTNADLFGENDPDNHIAKDFKKSVLNFGVVGTYLPTNEANTNIFFFRVDQNGSVVDGSERYYDGILLSLNNRSESETQDEGNAITGLSDGGFVLAGTMTTIENGKDIILIKIDAYGNFIWSRQLGGPDDEEAKSITETVNGSLLITGTNTVKGQSSIMLIKTDSNGKIEN
jgi:hypothetical protein